MSRDAVRELCVVLHTVVDGLEQRYAQREHHISNEVLAPIITKGFRLEKYLSNLRGELKLQALERSNWVITDAARLLGISHASICQFLAENPSLDKRQKNKRKP